MSCEAIFPFAVDDAALISTTTTETVPLWDAGTSYAVGDKARLDTTHRIYTSAAADNLGHDPASDDGSHWLDSAPTNGWAAFDARNGTQATADGDITFVVQTSGWIDRIAATNLSATSIRVIVEADGDEVHDRTYSLINDDPIVDLWSYLFTDILFGRDIVIDDVPLFPDMEFTVTIAGGDTRRVGNLVFGTALHIGELEFGYELGINDFSRPQFDVFGNYSFVPRPWAKDGSFVLWIESWRRQSLHQTFGELRGQPVVWRMNAELIFGKYNSLKLLRTQPQWDKMQLSIGGLT